MRSIILIECWFGPFPIWHDYYLRSCESNPSIEFIILHDAPLPRRRPKNVRWIKFSQGELIARASLVLDHPIQLKSPIKACDLRPAYGHIFEKEIEGYDFWGYNDSDVFWGDIRRFIPDDILDAHDVLDSCRLWISGQFTLLRNEGLTKHPHRLIPDFASHFETGELHYLDEHVLDDACTRAQLRIYRRQLQVHDIGSEDWKSKARQRHEQEGTPENEWFWEEGACQWKQGRLTHVNSGKESMFFHFRAWKTTWRNQHCFPSLTYCDHTQEGFIVDEMGLHPLFKRTILGFLAQLRFNAQLFRYRASIRLGAAIKRRFPKWRLASAQ